MQDDARAAAVHREDAVLTVDGSTVASGIYNGSFFDIAAKDSPLLITALHVQCTPGSLRAFATCTSESQVNAFTDWRRWKPVGALVVEDRGARNRAVTSSPASGGTDLVVIQLALPVPIEAGAVRGFHVQVSHDDGARLATHEVLEPGSVTAKDAHVQLLAGAGYVGYTPFFTRQADGLVDGHWRDGRGLVGGIVYSRCASLKEGEAETMAMAATATAEEAASAGLVSAKDFADARVEFAAKLTSLDEISPGIGPVNLQLITEWSGTACDPPLLTLELSAPHGDPTLLERPGLLPPLGSEPSPAEISALWGGNRALRALWDAYLRSFGWGLDPWLAELLAVSVWLLPTAGMPAVSEGACVQVLRSLLCKEASLLPARAHQLAALLGIDNLHSSNSARLARRLKNARQLPGEPLVLRGLSVDDMAEGGTDGARVHAVQVELYKQDVSSLVGITLEDSWGTQEKGLDRAAVERLRASSSTLGGATGTAAHLPPPVVVGVAAGSPAARSGSVVVGQRLLEVNGHRLRGHTHGTEVLQSVEGKVVLRLSGRQSAADAVATAAAQPSNRKVLLARRHVRKATRLYAQSEKIAAEAHLRAACTIAESVLLRRLAGFKRSPEYTCACRLVRTQPSPVRLSDFSLIRRIGRGSFGVVYAARKEDSLALYALKMVHIARLRRERDETHMRLERQTLQRAASLNNPFLSILCYAFKEGPWLCLVMPFCPGGTLQVQLEERAEPQGGLPLDETRWIGSQLVMALSALHGSLGLIHRDVKPTNLVLKANGYYVLTDFGLSEGAGVSTKTGTRGYWAPEVVRQEVQAPAADWWSVGVVLAYAATGRHPFHELRDAAAVPADAQQGGEEDVHSFGAVRRRTAAQRAQIRAQRKAEEAKMNERTLHAPISELLSGPRVSRELEELLSLLLCRDVSARLSDATRVRAHSFFGASEWRLLEEQVLPAPFTPDPNLVYCKDFVPAMSIHEEALTDTVRPTDEVGHMLDEWDYCLPADSRTYAEEMECFANKFTGVSHS
jgi:serine/threonine protein kinase